MMVTPHETLLVRSPSHESINTELSLFSISSAASDAKLLRLLASKAGQGPELLAPGASPNPESKYQRRLHPGSAAEDTCKDLLTGCAVLCNALGLRRSFSAGDIYTSVKPNSLRNGTSEQQLWGVVMENRALGVGSRSVSTWAAAGGSQLPSPQRSLTHHQLISDRDEKARQSYIKRRLMTTYKALERLSQSEFNLDKLEAAAVSAAALALPGPTSLHVPPLPPGRKRNTVYSTDTGVILSAADLERERGRPLSKYERNMMIFNWLHTLDPEQSDMFT